MMLRRLAYITLAWTSLTLMSQCTVADESVKTRNHNDHATHLKGESIDLSGCGKTKGCMRAPKQCLPRQCDYLVTWQEDKTKNEVAFEISAKASSQTPWVAVGFSDDTNMPKTSVVDCIWDQSGQIQVQASYNPGFYNEVLQNRELGILPEKSSGSFVDGVLSCKFTKLLYVSQASNESSKVADLRNKHYLFLASGPADDQGVKQIHKSSPLKSPYKINIAKNIDIIIGQNAFIVAHAALMILSWMFFSSIGIVCSRHLKNAWNSHVCGQKVWFQIHRALMIIVLLLTFVALVLIIVAMDWTPIQSAELHPILGLVVVGLMIMNFILGLCRPHPTASGRPVFNWIHSLVGNGAHFVAVAAMFCGVRMLSTKVQSFPSWPQWIVIAFGCWRGLTEILMTTQKLLSKEDLQVAYIEMSGGMEGMHLENPAFRFKTITVVIYLCGVTGLSVTLLHSLITSVIYEA